MVAIAVVDYLGEGRPAREMGRWLLIVLAASALLATSPREEPVPATGRVEGHTILPVGESTVTMGLVATISNRARATSMPVRVSLDPPVDARASPRGPQLSDESSPVAVTLLDEDGTSVSSTYLTEAPCTPRLCQVTVYLRATTANRWRRIRRLG